MQLPCNVAALSFHRWHFAVTSLPLPIATQCGHFKQPLLLSDWECALFRMLSPLTVTVGTGMKHWDLFGSENFAVNKARSVLGKSHLICIVSSLQLSLSRRQRISSQLLYSDNDWKCSLGFFRQIKSDPSGKYILICLLVKQGRGKVNLLWLNYRRPHSSESWKRNNLWFGSAFQY